MKKIRVYSLFGLHTYYKEIIDFPPSNVIYSQKKLGEYKTGTKLKENFLRKLLFATRMLRFGYVFNPGKSELIHSSRGILILNKKDWVLDIDNSGSFVNFKYKLLENPFYRKVIARSLTSNFCKKIMPWSNAGKESILNSLELRKMENKFEVLYPAMHIPVQRNKRKNENLKILFIGAFYRKGGRDTLEAFDTLNKKYDIELVMISDVPEEFKKKYKSFPNVQFEQLGMPRKNLLNKFYPEADIFLYPTYWDIFGFVILEAMSFSLPVISTNIYAIPEAIENEKNGFLLNAPIFWHDNKFLPKQKVVSNFNEIIKSKHPFIVKEIIKKTSLLIDDSSLRKKMGRNGKNLIAKGKFSIKERNKKLKRIYEEAIE
jgi:glycosyltransferase involved in cell wall biosynthesis